MDQPANSTRSNPHSDDAANAVVQLRSVRKVYGRARSGVVALDGVTLGFPAGTFTAVMGPSGSGKSTCLHCAAGLDRPTSGSVVLDGTELPGMSERALTKLARVGYERLLMPASLVVEHSDSGLVPQVLVRTEPGSSPRQLAATLGALPKSPPGMRVTGPDEAVAAQAQQEQTGTWVNYLLVAVLVGYAVIALVNTLVIATGERRRELALQRLIGATRGQVLRMMFTESILVTAVGIVLGTAIALATVIPFNLAIGNESVLGGPLWIYLAVAGSTTALALATTMLTTGYTLRARPVEAAVAPDE